MVLPNLANVCDRTLVSANVIGLFRGEMKTAADMLRYAEALL